MNNFPSNVVIELHEDTLKNVRAIYGLDKPEKLNQALDILEEWVKKQDHFNKKNFPREYLERKLISCKGSIEKTKLKLDKHCTLRTLLPSLHEIFNLKTEYKYPETILYALLPKLTTDNERVILIKYYGTKFNEPYLNCYRFFVMVMEYIMKYDYLIGIILVLDFMDADLVQILKNVDIVEFRQALAIAIDGYGHRIRGAYIMTKSNAIDKFLSIVKQFMSKKIANLIEVQKSYESLHKYVSKTVLPQELGGEERPLKEIHDQLIDVLSSKDFQEYLQEMKKATVNENFRQKDKFCETYMGMPGSFTALRVD